VALPVESRPAARYSAREELVHYLTHGVGGAASLVGLAWLIYATAGRGWVLCLSCAVYGAAQVIMFATSTGYHAVSARFITAKRWLRTFDHCAIFLLIAATYTPFVAVSVGGTPALISLGAVWLLALLGIATKVSKRARFQAGPVIPSLILGVPLAFALPTIGRALGTEGVTLLTAGGLTYAAGIPFYLWRRLDFHHAIWHLFVLVGSALHFLTVALYVVPSQIAR
jgi:hemolysin III